MSPARIRSPRPAAHAADAAPPRGGPLAIVALDTDLLLPPRRLDSYLMAINRVLETRFLTEEPRARISAFQLGSIHLVACDATPRRSRRTRALHARDRHDGISLQLVTAGRATGNADGRRIVSVPGTVMVLDYARPFTVTDEEFRSVINFSVPRAVMAELVADPAALHGRVLDTRESGLLAAFLPALLDRLPTLSAADGPGLETVLIELTRSTLADRNRSAPDRALDLRERIDRMIEARLGAEDLDPAWIAAKLGRPRSEVYAAFRAEGGIARRIWRRRLEAAREALLDPDDDRPIGTIAATFGFASNAHFARAFKAAYGATATDMRETAGRRTPA